MIITLQVIHRWDDTQFANIKKWADTFLIDDAAKASEVTQQLRTSANALGDAVAKVSPTHK